MSSSLAIRLSVRFSQNLRLPDQLSKVVRRVVAAIDQLPILTVEGGRLAVPPVSIFLVAKWVAPTRWVALSNVVRCKGDAAMNYPLANL